MFRQSIVQEFLVLVVVVAMLALDVRGLSLIPPTRVNGDVVGTNVQYNEPAMSVIRPQANGPQSTVWGHQVATGDKPVQVQNFKSEAEGGSSFVPQQQQPQYILPPQPQTPPQVQYPYSQQYPLQQTPQYSQQQQQQTSYYRQTDGATLIGPEPEQDSHSEELRVSYQQQLGEQQSTWGTQRQQQPVLGAYYGGGASNPQQQQQPNQQGISSNTAGTQYAIGPANQVQSYSTMIINNYNNATKQPQRKHKGRSTVLDIAPTNRGTQAVKIQRGDKRLNVEVTPLPPLRGRSAIQSGAIQVRIPQPNADGKFKITDNVQIATGDKRVNVAIPESFVAPSRGRMIIGSDVIIGSDHVISDRFREVPATYTEDDVEIFEEGIEWLLIGPGESRRKCSYTKPRCPNPAHRCISIRGFASAFCAPCNRACTMRPDCKCLTPGEFSGLDVAGSIISDRTDHRVIKQHRPIAKPMIVRPIPKKKCDDSSSEEENEQWRPELRNQHRDVILPDISVTSSRISIGGATSCVSVEGTDRVRFLRDFDEFGIRVNDERRRCGAGRACVVRGTECRVVPGCEREGPLCVCSKYCAKFPEVCEYRCQQMND